MSDHLEIPISTPFDNMQQLFSYKPNRLALGREFEKHVATIRNFCRLLSRQNYIV